MTSWRGLLWLETRRLMARDITRIVGLLIVIGVVLSGLGAFVSSSQARSDFDIFYEKRAGDAPQRLEECLSGAEGEVSSLDLRRILESGRKPSFRECRALAIALQTPSEPRFIFAREALTAVSGVIFPIALLALTLAASSVGADWRAGTLSTFLTWEPRRLRIFTSKMIPPVVGGTLIFLVGTGLVVASLYPAARFRGTFAGLSPLWWDHFWDQILRGTIVVAMAAIVGFLAAALIRNTLAAIGATVGWVAVAETIIRSFTGALNPWLISPNVRIIAQGWDFDPRFMTPLVGSRTPEEAASLLGLYLLGLLIVTGVVLWRSDMATSTG